MNKRLQILVTRAQSDDGVGEMLVRSRPTHSENASSPLLSHRQSEVEHAEDLEGAEDDKGDAAAQRVGDQRDEESNENVE